MHASNQPCIHSSATDTTFVDQNPSGKAPPAAIELAESVPVRTLPGPRTFRLNPSIHPSIHPPRVRRLHSLCPDSYRPMPRCNATQRTKKRNPGSLICNNRETGKETAADTIAEHQQPRGPPDRAPIHGDRLLRRSDTRHDTPRHATTRHATTRRNHDDYTPSPARR